jgi:CRP-like cAMP-binding protein
LAQISRLRDFHPGEILLQEGHVPAGCYLVVEGQVEISHAAGHGVPLRISTIGPGGIFGEMSVIGDEPSAYSASALVATRCVCVLRPDFLAEMRRHPEIAVGLLPVLVRRTEEALAARR